jgi:hypothetical protein
VRSGWLAGSRLDAATSPPTPGAVGPERARCGAAARSGNGSPRLRAARTPPRPRRGHPEPRGQRPSRGQRAGRAEATLADGPAQLLPELVVQRSSSATVAGRARPPTVLIPAAERTQHGLVMRIIGSSGEGTSREDRMMHPTLISQVAQQGWPNGPCRARVAGPGRGKRDQAPPRVAQAGAPRVPWPAGACAHSWAQQRLGRPHADKRR